MPNVPGLPLRKQGRKLQRIQRAIRRQLWLEKLDPRQLFCADYAPGLTGDPYISLHDHDGNLMDNWQELVELHENWHNHGHGHGHDHDHGDHDHDHEDDEHDCEAEGDHEPGCNCPACVGHGPGCGCGACAGHGPGCGCESCLGSSSEGMLSVDAIDPDAVGDPLAPETYNARYAWPQAGGPGTPFTITYSYSNLFDGILGGSLTESQMRAATEEALGLWAAYAPINFVEVVDAGPAVSDDTSYLAAGTPDIRIGHHAIDGGYGVLAHAYYPSTTYWGIAGDVHMDTGETWTLGASGGFDFIEVMTHEIGHAIGLGHESGASAIMNPYYGGRFSGLGAGYLLADDIAGIQAIYGSGTGSVTSLTANNNAPTIAAIANQQIAHTQDTLVLAVSANDADGDTLTYTATAYQYDEVSMTAYQLDAAHNFQSAGYDYYNTRGYGEKYFLGDGGAQWYYILGNGETYQWGGSIENSTLVGRLDSSYHSDLNNLFDVTAPSPEAAEATLSWSGSNLTIDPNNGYVGTLYLNVSVSDGQASADSSFTLAVTNSAPVISEVADQNMSYTNNSIALPITVTDAEGDTISYSANAYQYDAVEYNAFQLDQQHNFQSAGSDYFNYRGMGEKYVTGDGGNWFYILSDGSLYQWGGSVGSSTLLGTLDSTYHTDVANLIDVQTPTATAVNATLSWSSNTLTIDPDNAYLGTFFVEVTADDGHYTHTDTFSVTVSNSTPTIAEVNNQSMSYATDWIVIALSTGDVDGDSLTLNATAVSTDPTAQTAYDLDQAHSFYASGSDYLNYRGHNERYFQGNNGWYFILSDGSVYEWTGTISGSTRLGTLDNTYYGDLDTVVNATQPTPTTANAILSISGSNLTINPDADFRGIMTVTVTADDGTSTCVETFSVSVTNSSPTVTNVVDQTMSEDTDSIVVNVVTADADGDSLTVTTTATEIDAVAQAAYNLDQTHNFYAAPSDYHNFRGYGERYFMGDNGWYFMFDDGRVYSWGGSIGGSTLLGTLDASYHSNLNLLLEATAPTPTTANVTLSLVGSNLTIDPANGYTGTFTVTVTADDGNTSAVQTFDVTVTPSGAFSAPEAAQDTPDSNLTEAGILAKLDSIDELLHEAHQLDQINDQSVEQESLETATFAHAVDSVIDDWNARSLHDRVVTERESTEIDELELGLLDAVDSLFGELEELAL